MIFKKEAEFEDALIKVLFNKGWSSEVIMYPTEEDLIQNWANILFDNNQSIDRLNGCPLTSGEMQQIMEQIKTLRTPLMLNKFINGKTISITRDNADDKLHFGKEVSLKIYDRKEIAAGPRLGDLADSLRRIYEYHTNENGPPSEGRESKEIQIIPSCARCADGCGEIFY